MIRALLARGLAIAVLSGVPAFAVEKLSPEDPAFRRGACLFLFGEEAFLVGGEIDGRPVSTVERMVFPAEVATRAIDLELSLPRTAAASVVTSDGVFIVGGRTADGQPLASVEWVQADDRGRLEGPSQIEPGTGLNLPRSDHMAIAIGNWVYVLGGAGPEGLLRSIERAPITPEGSLGRFEEVASSSLVVPRAGAVAVRLGSRLLVGGGLSGRGQVLDSWEQALIDDRGQLGPFEPVPGVRLNVARERAGIVAHDGRLIVGGGGSSGSGPLRSTEIATWSIDAGLSPFLAGPELDRPRLGPLLWVASGDLRVLDGAGGAETVAWSSVQASEQAAVAGSGRVPEGDPLEQGSRSPDRDAVTEPAPVSSPSVLPGALASPSVSPDVPVTGPDGPPPAATASVGS